jgi:hypothetical protein
VVIAAILALSLRKLPHYMDPPITSPSSVRCVPLSTGLTGEEVRRRLEKFGPNTVADTALHPLRRALTKFWALVPTIRGSAPAAPNSAETFDRVLGSRAAVLALALRMTTIPYR